MSNTTKLSKADKLAAKEAAAAAKVQAKEAAATAKAEKVATFNEGFSKGFTNGHADMTKLITARVKAITYSDDKKIQKQILALTLAAVKGL